MGESTEPHSFEIPAERRNDLPMENELGTCYFPLLTDGVIIDQDAWYEAASDCRQLITLDIGTLADGLELQEFCTEHAVKLSTIFQTVWAFVFGSYAGSDEVAFIAVSTTDGVDNVGVCGAQLDRNEKIVQILKDIEAKLDESFLAYQSISLAEFRLRTAVKGRQAFNSVVVFQESSNDAISTIQNDKQGEDEFISIHVKKSEERVEVELSYPIAVLPKGQAENVASTFCQILSDIIEQPHKTLAEVDFVSQKHLDKIWSWNKDYPKMVSKCVHDLIEAQARIRPDAQAIYSSDGNMTYSMLSALSNRLAHHLVALGVGPEVIVPLCFEKSVWAMVAILGVVKAGGAIVSLDAHQPMARLNGLMDQIKATLVLTSQRHGKLWEDRMRVFVVSEESIAKLPAHQEPPRTSVQPNNTLYLIFTSGSTGTPKGCVVEHASFLTAAAQHIKYSNMSPSSRILQMTPYTFDVSMLEIFTALTSGACVCICDEESAQKGISSIINEMGITWTFMTPSLIRLVEPDDVPGLKQLALGGEALSQSDITTWADRLQLINGYGPTECSVAATFNERLARNTDAANIGRGGGAICWVVKADDHDSLVPIGAVGELLIHGPIVARGYFNNPEKTAEVFIEDPAFLQKSPGHKNRLYKTGDLVRNNSDGTINFIGRKDKQVKLRGLRIELGEIEHHLSIDDHVRHALVVLPKTGRCKQRLVAVLSLHDFEPRATNDAEVHMIREEDKKQSRLLASQIRERVAKHLATYMVPTDWVILEALPMTTSGKINGVVMTKWIENMSEEIYNEIADVAAETEVDVPATEMEIILQTIWAEVLKIDVTQVGLNRSFISLGGDSIASMRVASRCRAQNIDVRVQDILQTKSVAELALRAKVSNSHFNSSGDEPSRAVKLWPIERASRIGKDLLSKISVSSVDDIEDVYGCSPMQEGILLSQAKVPGTYEIRQVLSVKSQGSGNFDIQRLQTAWQKVVNRHPMLRTIFVDAISDLSDDSLFHQIVLRHFEADVKQIEYSGPESASEVSSFLKGQMSIDYSEPRPHHRLTLCKTSSNSVHLMVEISHALIDGGSTEIILRDLALAFDDLLPDGSGPLYGDYISYLQSLPENESMGHWTKYLAGTQPCIVPMYNGGSKKTKQTRSMPVEFDKASELLQFCESHGVTVANMLQTAWGLVLRAYTGSNDVCFGYIASGRDAPVEGIEQAVGAFINMLVCRLTIGEKAGVVELAKKMQDDYFAGLSHQHCSLAKIQHALNMSGMPLFNTIVSLQRSVSDEKFGSSISFGAADEDDPTDFDIAVAIHVGDNDLNISLGYWSTTMSDGEAANIASTFSGAISCILERGNTIVNELDLFNERHRAQVWDWNREEPPRIDACVHEFVNWQVMAQPDAPAVCSWDREFTYRELHDLSDRLAYQLVKLGVRPEVLVPHCFDKSAWSTVSTLAIMKAGGAGVGLSPAHPISRLQSIIEECRAQIILAAPKHAHLFDGLVKEIVVIEPSFVENLPPVPEEFRFPQTEHTNPAFVSFTSGSTGKPKGIVLEHGSLITSIEAHGSKWNIGPGTRVLQFSAYAFDASVSDTFTTLSRGGCVCIPSEQERLDDLPGAIKRMDVNWAFLTPRVCGTLSPETVPCLKTILLGGEAISKEDVEPWTEALDLIICYGPTECTIFSMGTEPVTKTSDPANLGRAVGTRVWITEVGNTDRLSPVGCIGELIIEGRLVTREYLGMPEKTKEVYIENPKWMPRGLNEPPRRFYKTGDLVRYNPDGTMQFIGRKDTQVKIRGQRVELGEIEHAIMQNLIDVAHVTVDSVVFQPNGQALVAFLSIKDTAQKHPDSGSLVLPLTPGMRSKLQVLEKALIECLPSYMVPAVFIPIAHIPMTISGKVDRIQLRAAALKLSTEQVAIYSLAGGHKTALSTDMERTLQKLWAKVLKKDLESIGRDDSFFRLGGDSIGAMKLVAAARETGILLAVSDIFRYAELSKMAEHIDGTEQGSSQSLQAELQPFELLRDADSLDSVLEEAASQCNVSKEEIQDIYPCTPLQEGLATISTTQQGAYVAQSAFHLPENLDVERFKQSWQKMVDTHSILRTRVIYASSSKSLQVILRRQTIVWQNHSSLDRYLKQDKEVPITYGGLLTRFAIIDAEDLSKRSFVWTAHHAVYDGWTVPMLLEQVARVYQDGFIQPEVPYNRFIQHIERVEAGASDAFWQSQMSGETPASFPRLPSATYQPRANRVHRQEMAVSSKSGSGITMAMVLRAAWAIVVSRYADSKDIVFGLTLSGRNSSLTDVEQMLGPTITTVPIKVHLDDSRTVAGFLEDTQSQALEMMPFEHTGLQNIRKVSNEAATAADFKNLFVVQPQSVAMTVGGEEQLLGLEAIPVDLREFDTYALLMECAFGEGKVEVEARYDGAIISQDQIQRLLFQYEHVVQQINNQSSTTTLGEIDLFCEQDRKQVWEWNAIAPVRNDDCVHKKIEQQASLHPHAIAVESWDGNFTYQDLDSLSSRLAHHIYIKLGIREEDLVPMCFDKSAWTIITMLAVVKAGGACVMLNPEHPVSRLKAILEDVNPRIILTAPQHQGLFDTIPGIAVSIDASYIQRLPVVSSAQMARIKVSPSNPGYILFTSGSTGKPKGIIVQHNSLCTVATQHGEGLGFKREGLRVLQFAAYTFDVSVGEIFITLMVGGTICIPTEYDRINNLAGVINAMKINWTFMTPTVAALLDPKDVPGLETLVLGGEAVSQSLVNRWSNNLKMIDSYGPAECTIWTSHALPGPTVSPANIGKGVGCRMWIAELSDHNRLSPVGCVGELLIEGPIVARGYINEPEKTKAAFIENPQWLQDGGSEPRRLYKSGDLVRYNSDGSINFVGRKDTQVKFHGQRIELGEIEYHLRARPEIEAGMVALPKAGLCKAKLVGIVAFREFEPLAIEDSTVTLVNTKHKARAQEQIANIREGLSGLLPPYMVPSIWVVLDAIPLTASRKINRNPISKWIEEISEEAYLEVVDVATTKNELPSTVMEKVLTDIWSRVLDIPEASIGVNRSFLSLGGDSITAMQVVSRCRSLKIEIGVQDILQSKSLSALALRVKSTTQSSISKDEEYDTAFHLSPIQQIYFDEVVAKSPTGKLSHHYNQSVLCRLTRPVQDLDVAAAIHRIVGQHSMLRAYFTQDETGKWMQAVSRDSSKSYRFVSHHVGSREEMLQINKTRQTSMDIKNGPIFTADLFNFAKHGQLISLAAHHLVIDLVSWRVILQNLEEILESGKMTMDTPLPFQTWNSLQAEQAKQLLPKEILPNDVPAADLGYWGMSTLPTWRNVEEVTFTADEETTSLLLGAANETLRTEPLDIILSVLLQSFGQAFDDRSLPSIFSEGHGREPWSSSIDLSTTVGWFTTFSPLHVPLDARDGIINFVRQTKDTRRQIVDNGRPYFSCRHFNTEGIRAFKHHNQMEICFNYLGRYQQLEREGALLREEPLLDGESLHNVGQDMKRLAVFDISAVVTQGRFRFSFSFNRDMKHASKVRTWVKKCEELLTSTVNLLQFSKMQHTLSDFPLMSITYDGLSKLTETTLPLIGVPNSEIEDLYPCSPIQEGILLSQTRQPGTYEVRQIYQALTKDPSAMVDIHRLQAAWQKVVERHSILRTVFIDTVSKTGIYDQLVLKHYPADIKLLHYDGPDVVAFLENQPHVQYINPRPHHRITLCQSQGQVFCHLEISHSLIDGTSMALIMRDFTQAYEDLLPLSPGPLYSDYISYLLQQPESASLDYWKNYLMDIQPCHLPRLKERPMSAKSSPPRSVLAHVADESRLQRFCEKYEITMGNLFQAGWGLVLRSYTGSDEVCFGYMAAGRDVPVDNIYDAIGPYINVLVCRLIMEGETPVGQILKKMQDDYLSCLPHQHISLAKIQHELHISGSPLFNTIMSLQRLPAKGPEPNVSFEVVGAVDPTEYDVSLNVTLGGGDDVEIHMTYLDSHLSDDQAENLVNTFSTAIDRLVDSFENPIASLDMFSERDRRQVWNWNGETPEGVETCVHWLFEEQVRARPDAPAVQSWDGDANFTYRELDAAAMRFAQRLIQLGVGPEVLVPLCFDKSAWTVMTMVAVLKAGGAFVMLNPEHPVSRLEKLVRDTGGHLVITSPQHAKLFDGMGLAVIPMNGAAFEKLPPYTGFPPREVGPSNPATVVFTSGSTGLPKGIVLEHRSICTVATKHSPTVNLRPGARVLQFAAYTFDVSNGEQISSLVNGCCICIPSDHERMNDIAGAIRRMNVNWAFFTPTVANLVNPVDVPSLRTLLMGGEPVTQSLVKRWKSVQCVNSYGPAECSVWTSNAWQKNDGSVAPSNLGKGIASRLWVTEPGNDSRLCPVGCVGELLIEGPIVARYYLNNVEKTKASFIEDPVWLRHEVDSAGVYHKKRLYKTGDLVRYNSDGTLAYVGRNDTQVKLNGQRIELGEIENQVKLALSSPHQLIVEIITPKVRGSAKALALFLCESGNLKGDHGVDQLILPLTEQMQADFISLQAALGNTLPQYMIPSVFILVKYMPLTASKKLDRKVLRQLGNDLCEEDMASYSLADVSKQELSTAAEKVLQELWARILGISASSIGAGDSFFRLGGDSIGAMKLVTAARAQGLSLSVSEIFKHPKLANMAKALEELDQSAFPKEPLEPFTLIGKDNSLENLMEEAARQCDVSSDLIEDIYPCTPLQEGLMAISTQHQFAYVLQDIFKLPETLDIEYFKNAWEILVRRNTILRTRIIDTASGSFQIVLKEGISWQSSTSLEAYVEEDKKVPIVYGGPLVRYAIVDDGKDQSFIWTAHHAVYDGWTVPMLAAQVSAIYNNEALLPEVPYSRFIQYLSKVDSNASDSFWRSQFSGTSTSYPQLPSTSYQPRTDQVKSHSVTLSRSMSEITLPTVLRAAWALVLAAYSDSDDVLFGLTLSGRNAALENIAQMMGPTITTVPVRVGLKRTQAVTEFLKDIQQQATEMMPFEHTGLQNIRHLSKEAQAAVEFTNLLVIQPAAKASSDSDFLGLKQIPVDLADFDTYALVIECNLGEEKIDIEAQYDSTILSVEHVQNLLYQLEHVIHQLNNVDEYSQLTLNDVDLFGPRDLKQILEWNSVQPETVEACVHSMIEEQVFLRPNAPAVCSFDGNLTYRQLNNLSDRLAHHLVSLGVGPEVKVPLCFTKSAWTVVAQLAVMKSGGTICMLNPDHPISRLEGILADIDAKMIISEPASVTIFSGLGLTVIPLESSFIENLPVIAKPACTTVSPYHAVFVVYTSGSTGKPKGIILEHRSLTTSMLAHGKEMGIGPRTRTLQFAAYTFDVSMEEIIATLMLGGCVCVLSESDRMNNLAGAINELQASWSELTPTVASLLLPSSVPTLKTLALSGESVTQAVVETWAGSGVQLINTYGPSECSVSTSCSVSLATSRDPSNIGRGVGCTLWIVNANDHNRLAPVGTIGELLVEGPIVAREYLNDPEKTATVFVRNPAWSKHQSKEDLRLYKTGDLVKYNSDGTIKFIGRKDTQIKLHGQRIEMGEIEYNVKLALSDASYQVAVEVLSPEARGNTKVLAAFICQGDNTVGDMDNLVLPLSNAVQTSFSDLQTSLYNLLPSYMVPSLFIPLGFMPLSTAGKLDRKAIRQVANSLSSDLLTTYSLSGAEKRAPSTKTEKLLSKLWAEVLGTRDIGAEDNFFRLGGDSIGAMKLVAASRKESLQLIVADVFANPVLCRMAKAIDLSCEGESFKEELPLESFALLERENIGSLLEEAAEQCNMEKEFVQDIYPCTPLQEGLMAITARQEGVYVAQTVYRLPATMDVDRYKAAWQTLADVQPILRTRIIHTATSQSLQVVLQEKINWQSAPTLEEYVKQDNNLPMAYGAPLIRYGIVSGTKSDPHTYFIWTAHHSVYDGWSESILFEQVELVYLNDVSSLPPVSPYNKFIQYLANVDSTKSDAFWREQLSGGIPTSFPKLPSPTYQPQPTQTQSHSVAFPGKPQSGVTISTLLRAAWSFLMAQYTGSDDVVFGLVLSGRNAPVHGITNMIGPTISTVPVRVRLNHGSTVAQYMQNIQDQATQMMPFEQAGLQNIRRLSSDTSAASDFKNLFYIQPSFGSDSGALGLELIPTDKGAFDTYALLVECQLNDNGVEVVVRFDSNVIPAEQMKWMLYHFETIVQHLNQASIDMKLDDVVPFGHKDMDQILHWNGAAVPAYDVCMHELVKRKAVAYPERLAIHAWDGDLTYGQLNRLSARLASYLSSIGVGPETLVPLCFNKSVWAIVSMLAVLRSGGAVVMLNPEHPISRLTEMIQDMGAKHIIVGQQHVSLLQGLTKHLITVGATTIPQLPVRSISKEIVVDPRCPAFVTFTSGSTGKPKGVVTEHRALCTSARDHATVLRLNENSRVLQFAAYTFDISQAEIFTTLMHGGCVCVISDYDRMNDLAKAINKMNVNWACLTSTVAGLLHPSEVPGLKTLALSGEAPTEGNLLTWADKVRLLNIYGPSEASIWCACFEDLRSIDSPTNIGRGVGSRLWITNPQDHNKLSPIGCIGELLVEGPILARGYLGDAVKTAAAFIENPGWMQQHGGLGGEGRLYKTGDLARYNYDGTIDYLGRKDTQIKFHGQRIETKEIEHHIKILLPTMEVAVDAVALTSQTNKKVLIAYFYRDDSVSQEADPSKVALRLSDEIQDSFVALQTALFTVLPPYMVPSVFIPLKGMPVNPSGKLNRILLRQMVNGLSDEQFRSYSLANATKRAPSTTAEKALAHLWAQVLGIAEDSVGANDNFFRLGGDSIVAMKLVSAARTAGIILSVSDIFQHPRLVDAAAHLADNSEKPAQPQVAYKPFSCLNVTDVDSFLQDVIAPKAHVKKDNILDVLDTTAFQDLAITGGLTEPRWMLNYFWFDGKGPLDIPRMRKSCFELVQNFKILRTVFVSHRAKFLQVVLRTLEPKFFVYETDQDLDDFTNNAYEESLRRDLKLEEPYVQFTVIKKRNNTLHRIIMRLSHAQYDGVSLPRIWEALKAAYDGQAIPEPTAFSDYVFQSRTQNTIESISHWKSLLAGSSMTDIVSRQKPELRKHSDIVRTLSQTIPYLPLTMEGITFATAIKSAWSLIIAQLAAKSDVVFGHTISGRNLAVESVEKVVGPCLNVVPVRVIFQPTWRVIDLLRYVQDQQLANIPFESLGFRDIIKQCTDWPQWSHFSSIVQHQNIDPDESIPLGDTVYEPGFIGSGLDLVDIAILSTPLGDKVEIQLTSTSPTIEPVFAEELLGLLCKTILSFSSNPDTMLPSPSRISGCQRVIPVLSRSPGSSASTRSLEFLDEKDAMKLQTTVEDAWNNILAPAGSIALDIRPESCFFKLGGDLIAMAQLTVLFREQGLAVSLEDLVEYSTFNGHVDLLSAKSVRV